VSYKKQELLNLRVKGNTKKNNPEKPATQGTIGEEKHNATCVGHHHTQTLIILQTTGGKDEPNTAFKTIKKWDFFPKSNRLYCIP
jgi:hypothetical protein